MSTTRRTKGPTLVACGLLMAAAGRVAGDLIVHESFNYPANTTISGQTATGVGLSGSWATVSGTAGKHIILSGDLAYGDLVTSGDNRIQSSPAGSNENLAALLSATAKATLNPANGETKTRWLSFLVKAPAVFSTGGAGIALERDTGTDLMNRFLASNDANSNWGVRAGNATATYSSPTEPLSVGETYFYLGKLVMSLSGTTRTVTMTGWRFSGGILPESEEILDSGVTSTNSATFERFPHKLVVICTFADYEYDEIRIGETFADVVVRPKASETLIMLR